MNIKYFITLKNIYIIIDENIKTNSSFELKYFIFPIFNFVVFIILTVILFYKPSLSEEEILAIRNNNKKSDKDTESDTTEGRVEDIGEDLVEDRGSYQVDNTMSPVQNIEYNNLELKVNENIVKIEEINNNLNNKINSLNVDNKLTKEKIINIIENYITKDEITNRINEQNNDNSDNKLTDKNKKSLQKRRDILEKLYGPRRQTRGSIEEGITDKIRQLNEKLDTNNSNDKTNTKNMNITFNKITTSEFNATTSLSAPYFIIDTTKVEISRNLKVIGNINVFNGSKRNIQIKNDSSIFKTQAIYLLQM